MTGLLALGREWKKVGGAELSIVLDLREWKYVWEYNNTRLKRGDLGHKFSLPGALPECLLRKT